MGYTGGSIADVTDRARRGAKLAGERMAKLGGEEVTRHTKMNTPIGEPDPLDPTGGDDYTHLREQIYEKPVVYKVVDGVGSWESGAETDVDYAPFVEEGTGLWGPEHRKYKIEPKDPNGVLAFFSRMQTPEGAPMLSGSRRANLVHGNQVFVRYVMHPGSPGQHMFAIGVEMAEVQLPAIGSQGIRTMKNYVERG